MRLDCATVAAANISQWPNPNSSLSQIQSLGPLQDILILWLQSQQKGFRCSVADSCNLTRVLTCVYPFEKICPFKCHYQDNKPRATAGLQVSFEAKRRLATAFALLASYVAPLWEMKEGHFSTTVWFLLFCRPRGTRALTSSG